MATWQANTLIHALKNIRNISSNIAATDGGLTMTISNTRAAIALEFTFFVQNIRAVKATDPIVKTYPNVHYNLKDRTTAPARWDEIADSVYDGLPHDEDIDIGGHDFG